MVTHSPTVRTAAPTEWRPTTPDPRLEDRTWLARRVRPARSLLMRHLLRSLFTAAVAAALLAGCHVTEVGDPGPTVPARWGAHLRPTEVAYGGPGQRADVYPPTKGGNRGVIILVHGGGFFTGDRTHARDHVGLVMSQTDRGFGVLNISYRLVSGHTNAFPTAVRDVDAAVRWVRTHGRNHGLNPSTVIVAGESAGGTLASLVGVGWNSDPAGPLGRTERVDGWVSVSGIMDFTAAGRTAVVDTLGQAWLGPNAKHGSWLRAASPVAHLDPNDPPGYLIHGDRDTTVERGQVDALIGAARGAKTNADRVHYDIVDTGAAAACRGHTPACGANAAQFNWWVDQVAARRL